MRCFIIASLLLLGGCSFDGGCADTVLEAKPDLEGPLIAWRYVRDCGTTADYSMNIAIGPREGGLAGATRVFTADSDHGLAEMDGKHLWVEMQWTRPHQLSVAHGEGARVFRSAADAAGATIRYRVSTRHVVTPEVPVVLPMPSLPD